MSTILRSFIVIVLLLQCSCATPSFDELLASADKLAVEAGFTKRYIQGGKFSLISYIKASNTLVTDVTIYIEGDGKSMVTRNRPSLNPTPHQPLALHLAAVDKQSKNIIYLGRPCHFRPTGADAECDIKYWTRYRYSQTVVDSLSDALDQLQQSYGFERINLVGFSGGGALAVLLAAQRPNVVSIRTVAANLDVDAFVAWHRVSPMSNSLNPVVVTDRLKYIPQRHYFGDADQVVPRAIGDSYLAYFSDKRCVQLIELTGLGHLNGWAALWPQLLAQPVGCER